MNDLEKARDHARAMATRAHRKGCHCDDAPRRLNDMSRFEFVVNEFPCANHEEHAAHTWTMTGPPGCVAEVRCHGVHDACVPESERALWKQIADELDAYLAPDDEQEALL